MLAPNEAVSAATTPEVTRLEDRPRTRGDPSRPSKRALVALLALIGAAVAGRLAAFQLGWTGPPWEPFFGDGTRRVLESPFSRSLPFPDAGLGVMAYVAEAIAARGEGPRAGAVARGRSSSMRPLRPRWRQEVPGS